MLYCTVEHVDVQDGGQAESKSQKEFTALNSNNSIAIIQNAEVRDASCWEQMGLMCGIWCNFFSCVVCNNCMLLHRLLTGEWCILPVSTQNSNPICCYLWLRLRNFTRATFSLIMWIDATTRAAFFVPLNLKNAPPRPLCYILSQMRCFAFFDKERSYIYVRENSLEMNNAYADCCGASGCNHDSTSVQYFDRAPFRRKCTLCCFLDDSGACTMHADPRPEAAKQGCVCCCMEFSLHEIVSEHRAWAVCVQRTDGYRFIHFPSESKFCPLHKTNNDRV